jgi:hypothetical protein
MPLRGKDARTPTSRRACAHAGSIVKCPFGPRERFLRTARRRLSTARAHGTRRAVHRVRRVTGGVRTKIQALNATSHADVGAALKRLRIFLTSNDLQDEKGSHEANAEA